MGVRYSYEVRPILRWQKSDFYLLTIDGSTIHLHLHNFDMSLKGGKISPETTSIEKWLRPNAGLSESWILHTQHAFGGCFMECGIEHGPFCPMPDAIITKLHIYKRLLLKYLKNFGFLFNFLACSIQFEYLWQSISTGQIICQWNFLKSKIKFYL